ncbi:MAG: NTP transferase domain-containing protein [Bacteroidota bacterium]|nr:NTP transferase domain-containing protein [Bacteroidota bacterium]
MTKQESSVIILAAGNSSRMGKAKFALKMSKGKSFLQHIAERYYDFGCKEIIVVLNQKGLEHLFKNPIPIPNNATIVLNPQPDWERFYSIQCGLKSLKNNHPVFIHNVDNPFVNTDDLEKLVSDLPGYDFVKPVFQNKGGHPVLLSCKLVRIILSEQNKKSNLKEFLSKYRGKSIKVNDANILVNTNTEEEYRRIITEKQFQKEKKKI